MKIDSQVSIGRVTDSLHCYSVAFRDAESIDDELDRVFFRSNANFILLGDNCSDVLTIHKTRIVCCPISCNQRSQ